MVAPDPNRSGLAQGRKVIDALRKGGITAAGWFWRWRPGLGGGVFDPHQAQNGEFVTDILEWPALPQDDVNGDYCMCSTQTVWRGEGGRFAPGPR